MARYVITGIAGFIGSTLARELLRLGHTVCGIDNLVCSDLRNLTPLLTDLEFECMDINDTDRLREFCRGADYVLHEAALASVPRSVQDPVGTNRANVDGTLSVLIAARDAGVGRVVYAASSSAYGDQATQPKHERMVPSPISPYAVQKITGEHYVQSFWHAYGLEGVCLRYFNVFGPRQSANSPYSGVIARFITDMMEGTIPTIYGTGAQSRDFTFVANVVSANLLACTAPSQSVAGKVMNVGTGTSHTLNSLHEALSQLLGLSTRPYYLPGRTGDIEHSEADVSLARRLLGYEPSISFQAGLDATVEWYLQQGPATCGLQQLRSGESSGIPVAV